MRYVSYLPFFLILSVSSSAFADTTDLVYLTCDAERYYTHTETEKLSPVRLHYKIDTERSDIMEFNSDLGKYETLCGKNVTNWKVGLSEGNCTIGDDLIFLQNTRLYFGFTVWTNINFFRHSGRISGSTWFFDGVATEIDDVIDNKRNLLRSYDIRGNCQKGPDMSKIKKAF